MQKKVQETATEVNKYSGEKRKKKKRGKKKIHVYMYIYSVVFSWILGRIFS